MINDHVASVVMMDDVIDDAKSESVIEEASIDSCDGEDISRTARPSSQNEQIVTNAVCKELTSMLLNTCRLCDIGHSCYELMSMMELGKIEKGSIFLDTKAKLLRQRWFSAKHRSAPSSGDVAYTGDLEQNFVQCDSLIKLRCKRGKHEAIKH